MRTTTSRDELVDEASNWIVGGGIVTMSLFPLALPGIALVAVAALPLLALALPVVLIGGLGMVVFRLARAVARRAASLRWGGVGSGDSSPVRVAETVATTHRPV